MLVDFDDGVVASITCGRVGWHAWRRPFLARVVIVGELHAPGRQAADPTRSCRGRWSF